MLRLLRAVILTILLVSNSQPAESETPKTANNRPVRDKWALIVGVGSFQNPTIPNLKYAPKDARDFREFLINEANFAPDHVRILVDEKATQRRVLSELGNKFLARVAKPDDLVVLFFSSHGSPAQADVRGKNFVVAYDSDPEDLFTTGIEMDKIIESIQARVLSERVLLILDACHSGGAMVANAKGLSRSGNFDAEQIAQGSGQMVICSSEPDQQSWESRRYQNGIFTRKLLESLRLKGKQTTLGDAFPYVKDSVAAEVQEDFGHRQSPSLRSQWNGSDLVLAAMPNNPQALPAVVHDMLQPDSSVPTASAPAKLPSPAPAKLPLPVSAADQRLSSKPAITLPNDWRRAIFMYKRGDYASAVDVLQAAVKGPAAKDAEAHFHLANALARIGRTADGLKEYRQSFALNPNGRNADYCLQMMNYYSSRSVTTRTNQAMSTARPASQSLQSVIVAPYVAPGQTGSTNLVNPDLIAQIRTRMPKIPSTRPNHPYPSEVMSWTLQDRANYVSEALNRSEEAKLKVEEAERLLSTAKNAAAGLLPNARAYGESEEAYKARLSAGQTIFNQLLLPYVAELDLKSKRCQDEDSMLQACQSAYNQAFGRNVYQVPCKTKTK